MEKKSIELGRVVQLASGGPRMTVVSRHESRAEKSEPVCRCMYFAVDGRPVEVMIPEAALVVTEAVSGV